MFSTSPWAMVTMHHKFSQQRDMQNYHFENYCE